MKKRVLFLGVAFVTFVLALSSSQPVFATIEDTFCIGTCDPLYPDVAVEQIDWTPGSPLVGDIMHLTVHVENQGDSDTSPWGQVGVRLFIDGISIGDDYAGNIAPGTTEFFDFYWAATSGCHTVRAVADYGDYIPESDEDNNEREESFDVTCPPPSAPSLSSPSNGSNTCDTTPYLNWSSVSGATSYRIQVDDSSSFTSPAIDTTTSNASYTPGTALSPGTYYWRVRASNACGDGPWSSAWSVTVLSTPGVPSLVSPSNGSTIDDSTPTLDWGGVSGATSYRVQVDDNSSFSSPEIDQATSNTSYAPSSALADGTYHWRVQASNSCGSGSWSAAWSFTIETSCPTPPAPSLSSPSDGSSTCDRTPYLNWSSVSRATSYRIQVDDSSSFTSPAIDTTASNSNYTPGTALAPGTYYWRVRASNACGDGPWSSAWSVTVLSTPGGPSLVSPANGSTIDDSTPTLDWGRVSGATSYRVQVDDNVNFSSPEIDQATSNTSYTPSSALADGTYHWRVQASNSCGSGSWSAVWSFTIETSCPAPPAPSLSSPSNGSSTCDTTPYLDWSSVSEATSYRIQVDASSSFTSSAIDTTASNSNYTPGTALAPDTYYWRVRASNACGDGSWSSVWSMTVLSTPGPPSLVSPSNGSTTDDSTPTLDWGRVSGATSYRVQADDNASFFSPEIDQTTSSSSYTPSSALADGTYHWRVQASNSCGSGFWSAVWSFSLTTLDNVVYFEPQHSSVSFCNTTSVDIKVDAANLKSGRVKFTYNAGCADVTGWVRNTSDFPMGTWDSGTPGQEWITFSADESLAGTYTIGTLTIHCESQDACTTSLDFLVGGSETSKLFDDWGSEISATWQDGTFECTTGLCGDVAPYPGCDGQINMGDVSLLHSYVGHPGQYVLCCQPCGDVAPYPGCDGQINMGDVSLLHSYVGHPGQYHLCCDAAAPSASVTPVSMPAKDQVSFRPQDSMASLSGTTEVQIRVEATNFKSGQVKFTYESTCADVTDWERNTSDFPMGTWESGTPGEEWITFSAQDAITGAYSIGTLTIRCISEEACTTPLDFVDDGPMTSKLFDDWGSEISTAWQDGRFQGGYSVYLPIVTRSCCSARSVTPRSVARSRMRRKARVGD